jgi:hypothetical protein
VTALQLYYGPDSSYANLPHSAVKNNLAIAVNSISGKYLNMSLTVSNSGSEVQQVYVRLYSKVVDASMITDANICTAINSALQSTVPAVRCWNNVTISQLATWCTGNFVYKLVGTENAYVLVATLTCQPLDQAPTCTPTEDPCVAVWAAQF